MIDRTVIGLTQDQAQRREEHPDVAEQVDSFINKLKELKLLKEPFTMV